MLLTFLTGERRGETLEVSAGPATAGRDAGCQISIRDPKISRRHCQIYIEGGIWRVRDLGSANGTWLDGKRVQQERLAASSVLKIGDTVLEVSSVEVPAAAGEADEEQRDAARDEGDTATTPADPDAIIAAAGPAAAPRKLLAGAGAILLLGIVAAAIFLPDAWRSLFRRGDEDPRSSGGATLDELAAAGGQPQPSAASSRPAAAEDPRRLAPTSRPQEVADPDAQRQQQRQPEPEPQPDPQQQQPDPQPEAGAAGAAMKGSEPSRPPSGSSQPESPGLDAGRAVAVERMLEGGEFQRALRLLAAASDGSEGGSPEAHAGGAAAASGERREIAARILAAAEAELRSCEERGKALVAEGRYGEARELFLDLAGRLPRDFIEPAMDALSRLGDVERGRLDAEKARADGLLAGGGRFCEAMAFLEYEAAEQVLDDLERALVPEPRRVDVDGGELEPERRIAAWREDLRLARLAWTAIANAWDDLSARGGRIALRWAEGRPRARLDHRGAIAAVEPGSTADEMLTARGRRGRWLRAGGPGGAGYLTDAACLADASLRQLLLRGLDPSGGGGQAAPRTAAPDASTPAAALATFLLYREGGRSYRLRGGDGGAGRTGRLASSGGEPTEHLPAEILSVEEIRRRRARALLERLLGAPAEAEEGAWEALSLEIAALLLSRSDPPDALPSRILRADYAAARARGLRAALPDDVFHGAAVELEGDSVRLAYDFRSPDQIRAFSSAGEGSALERTSAGALVRGEWRFLDGQPFRGALRVRATLHQGRSDEPPCAAVALWTAGGEPATPERTISVTKAMVKGAAWWGDYVVFASGLRRVLVDYGGDPRLEVYPASGDDAVPLPADVLLIGRGGAPLNSHEGECLWARRSESAPRANRAVEVAMDRGRAGWSIDGRSVLPSPRPSARRWLEPGDRERRGSFSLLTFGTTWRLESLEIEGDLDPRWLEERLRARVEDELAALLDARPGG